MPHDYLKPLLQPNGSKIVLLILDGLGGLPMGPSGQTALEFANTPALDQLAASGTLGQTTPIRPGITPGSGPAHLALFGYDPLTFDVGRGALAATGVGIDLEPGDVAARGNLCTLDENGLITDRRAGRISTEVAAPVLEILSRVQIPDVDIEIRPVKEYRFAIVMRGADLKADLSDTDPQKTGLVPLLVQAESSASARAAALFNQWIDAATQALTAEPVANGLTLRGFASEPGLPKFVDVYGLKAGCVAVYPMYKGVARLVGMQAVAVSGDTPADQFNAVQQHWHDYDFFFIHIKKTDSMGEDGNFEGKANIIEHVDQALAVLLDLQPDVLLITGDHSTPAKMKSHSWHPVPLLLHAPERALPDIQTQFGERACSQGGLGTLPATELMPIALAHAGRLAKFGA